MDMIDKAVEELDGKKERRNEADATGEMQLLYETQLDETWDMAIGEPFLFRDRYADTVLRVWPEEDGGRYKADIHRTETEAATRLQDALDYLENLGYDGRTIEVTG